jgi:hypothetical protein
LVLAAGLIVLAIIYVQRQRVLEAGIRDDPLTRELLALARGPVATP